MTGLRSAQGVIMRKGLSILAAAVVLAFATLMVAFDPNVVISPDMDVDYVDEIEIPNPLFDKMGKGDQLQLIVCEIEHEERCFGPMSWWHAQQIAVAYQDAGMVFLVEGDEYYAAALAEGTMSYADAWGLAPDGPLPVTAATAN